MALDEATGQTLWQFKTGSSINSTAITYTCKGRQYVTIASGLGGNEANVYAATKVPAGGLIWTFALMPAEFKQSCAVRPMGLGYWRPRRAPGKVSIAPPRFCDCSLSVGDCQPCLGQTIHICHEADQGRAGLIRDINTFNF